MSGCPLVGPSLSDMVMPYPGSQSTCPNTPHQRSGKVLGDQQRPEVSPLCVLGNSPWFHPNARVNVEVLVSGPQAPRCPLGIFPSSGWPRSQAQATQSLPVQRPAACLPGLLSGLALPGDPSIMPAKRMRRVMVLLKRQMSLRLESEGSCL